MNELIYGKNPTARIVSIEPRDSDAEIFRELEDGSVVSEIVPFSRYILFSEQYSNKMKPLKGNQFYKYIIEYDSEEKYREVLKSCNEKRYPLHTVRDPKEALMIKDGYTYFKGMKIEDVSVLSFDLETTGLVHDKTSQVLLISNTFRRKGKIERKLFSVDEFPSHASMLCAWANWVIDMNPSIILGHNIYGYDFPYLAHCFKMEGIPFGLGRKDSLVRFSSRSSQFRKDGSQSYDYNNVSIYGREIVDTMFLAMKYDGAARREYESYKLKDIIKHEGLEKKGRQFYDASKIGQNWHIPEEREKIKKYAIEDADDALALFDLMIPSFFYSAQSTPRSFQTIINSATGSQVNSLMVRAYLQQGHSIAKGSEKQDFEGAISFGIPGIHKNVFKIDVQSLYPSIILSDRICNRDKDPQEVFIKLVEFFTRERIINKERYEQTGERYYKDLSDSQKIGANSMYGFLGAPKLNYNSPEDAAKVTRIGRDILKKSILYASGKNFIASSLHDKPEMVPAITDMVTHNFVICNGDTDSIAFKKADEKPFTVEERAKILAELNALMPQHIVWKDDNYFRRFIVFKAKNYVMDDGKKVKLKGSALKGSKKEPALQVFTREIIDLLLKDRKDQVLFSYLAKVNEINSLKDITPWCFKVTVTKKVLYPEATFQKKQLEAIGDYPVSEGDKVYLFFKSDDSLCLRENFNGDFNREKLLCKLRDNLDVFENVLDVELFPDLTLKKNRELMQSIQQPNAIPRPFPISSIQTPQLLTR